MRREPLKRLGVLKLGLQRRTVFFADIDGAAGMVFAVSGWRAHRKHGVKRQALFQLATNDFGLALDASKRGNDMERYAISGSRGRQITPRFPGRRNQQVLPSVGSGFRNHQFLRFAADFQSPPRNKSRRDRKILQRCRDPLAKIDVYRFVSLHPRFPEKYHVALVEAATRYLHRIALKPEFAKA